MKKPSAGKNRVTHTICCTDEEWELVREGASRAGMSASAWWTECALTVDLSPKGGKARALVLDAERQRGLSDGVAALVRGLDAADEEALSQYRNDIRAMLEEPLRAMVRQGRREKAMELLRTVFGEDRATVIAAALVSKPEEAPRPTPPAEPEPERPGPAHHLREEDHIDERNEDVGNRGRKRHPGRGGGGEGQLGMRCGQNAEIERDEAVHENRDNGERQELPQPAFKQPLAEVEQAQDQEERGDG